MLAKDGQHNIGDQENLEWMNKMTDKKPNKKYFETPSGPMVMFDIDDTLIMWDTPFDKKDQEIAINCNGVTCHRVPNRYNIDLLKKFFESGHVVVVWSGSGVRWCKAVIEALGIEDYINGCMSKPSYYIDDIGDPKKWIGKHGYFDMGGKRSGHQTIQDK